MSHKNSLIERALSNYPETRNSDRKLMLAVWFLQDPDYMRHFKEFFQDKAISPETIRRKRQKLQEDGRYPADETVNEFRYQKFQQAQLSGAESLWDHE